MKQKKKNKRKKTNVKNKNRKVTKDKRLVATNVHGEKCLTIRGILIYWWFWNNRIYLKRFESIIDKFGEEIVLKAVIISHMLSFVPVQIIIYAMENNLEKEFFTKLNIDIMELPDYEMNKYINIRRNFIENIMSKYKSEINKNPYLEIKTLDGHIW